ncbi:MAG: hypothetical protein LUD15_11745 [Bacteroides sp.]|nr:hypothetical protein [Bacteroides sp.]
MYNEKLFSLLTDVLREKVESILKELKREIDRESSKGTIRYIAPYDLLLTMVSLNIFIL